MQSDCPAQPNKMISGDIEESEIYGTTVSCQYVFAGTCPEGYYCPPYVTEETEDAKIKSMLEANSCIIGSSAVSITNSASYSVICPCTPGYFCPANTSIPTLCVEGYYCPTNKAITTDILGNPIGPKGLGTWGTLSINCPEGHWCGSNQVEPFECYDRNRCPEQSSAKGDNTIAFILVIIFAVLVFVVFRFLKWKTSAHNDKVDNSVQLLKSQRGANKIDSNDDTIAARDPYLIEFEDINFTLKNGKTIMKGVNGSFSPGRLCAIMGPSGAGKTTVISLITGKAKKTSGRVKLNGTEHPDLSHLKKLTGFVPQEDTMIRNLSVRENIKFSASYRLPATFSDGDCEKAVNQTLVDLGIEHVQHSAIGDEYNRGVSGGQRKRVNIGIEMVADPTVLFLDEPTSGLDSTTATQLCTTLKDIASTRQMTVVSVIHQPSLSSFLVFDDLLLLGKGGQVCYHGPLDKAQEYFNEIGFPTPPVCNPADFYLDVVSGEIARKGFPNFEPSDLFSLWEEWRTTGKISSSNKNDLEGGEALGGDTQALENKDSVKNWVDMSWEEYRRRFMHQIYDYFDTTVEYWYAYFSEVASNFVSIFSCKTDPCRTTPGLMHQFRICFVRAIKQNFRSFRSWLLECLVHFVLGFVLAQAVVGLFAAGMPTPYCESLSVNLETDCKTIPSLQSDFQSGGIYLAFGISFAGVAVAAGTFLNETPNYWREAAAGMFSLPYFYAKLLADIPKIFSAAFFFWSAFNATFSATGSQGDFYLTLVMMYWFGFSIGYITSQIASKELVPIVGVMIALIFVAAFSAPGDFWFRKLSSPRWTIESFFLTSTSYYNTLPEGSGYEGQPYIDLQPTYNYYLFKEDNFGNDILYSFLCGVFWSFIGFLIMVLSNLEKKK